MLTKTVLCAAPGGGWTLVEVPFEWQRGDALPHDVSRQPFESATAAMSALADRGRRTARVHVPAPEATPSQAQREEPTVAPRDEPPSRRPFTPPGARSPDR